MKRGLKRILYDMKLLLLAILYILGIAFIVRHVDFKAGPFSLMLDSLYSYAIIIVSVLIAAFALYLLGAPIGFISIMQNMARTGLINSEGEPPVLMARTKKSSNRRAEIWEFETFGIAFSKWPDYFEQIESALNVAVTCAEPGDDGSRVLLTVIPRPGSWPKLLQWDTAYLPEKNSVFVLGENRGEKVYLDLSKIAHISISARTGGGKSILQQNLMLQCALHDMQIVLIDYKGGIDYSAWREHIKILTEDKTVIDSLNYLMDERKRRFDLFYDTRCANIDEYNAKFSEAKLSRICLFVDELTECLDKASVSKERKEYIATISDALSSLARLSRAAGIHLILAQQRGSADILPGSVRNNVYKVLGPCDENLSILTLGTADAAKRIPSTACGRFLDENGIMFQGYYSDFSPEMLSAIKFNNDFKITGE